MGSIQDNVFVSLATEADVPSIIDVIFSIFGPDTVENRARNTRALRNDIKENDGLRIVKAELTRGKVTATPTPLRPPAPSDETSDTVLDRYFWVEGGDCLARAAAIDRYGRQEIQRHVQGRVCANVQNMCVLPECQGQGIGHAIMSWGCREFDRERVDAYLEASIAGERLYKKFGFEIIGKTDKDFGDGVKMCHFHMWRNAKISAE
ncbi:hypothetical protein G7054_g7153 [Neopestalotiopsis clavispora]|nr:hypothetical protein G7054_g7153 [Neopestalotiopsis clavispora]